MPNWPIDLPQVPLVGFSDQRQKTRIRSEVDVGPAMMRRRYTGAVRNFDVPMTFSNTERQIFDTFYSVTLQEGTLSFVWTDPVTGNQANMRFRDETGPEFKGDIGGETDDRKRWSVTLSLEILP